MPMRVYPALLAAAATTTAACLSVQSGLQRGGLPVERALFVAVSVVLAVAAHLLPALCRPHGWHVRTAGALLWFGCIAATCYGHAVFFLTAARHAGELRAAAVPAVTAHGRDLSLIARDRADAVTRLARATARRCIEPCPSLGAERTDLAAKVAALDDEKAEALRFERAQDRAAAARAAVLADPVTVAVTTYGVPPARFDLVTGLAFAVVLEAVACFCWLLALGAAPVTENRVTPAQQGSHATSVARVTAPSNAVTPAVTEAPPAGAEPPDDLLQKHVTRARDGIATGAVRATVRDLQKYLGVAQKTATAVRKQLESEG